MDKVLYCPLDGDKLQVDEETDSLICDHGHAWDLELLGDGFFSLILTMM